MDGKLAICQNRHSLIKNILTSFIGDAENCFTQFPNVILQITSTDINNNNFNQN